MKNCLQCLNPFVVSPDDEKFYKKMKVPPPVRCPRCRMQRRFLARNTRKLYYRECDFSGEKIISQYHPSLPFPVYKPEYWWSGKWDGITYARDFDYAKPFFPQLLALKNTVPHQALFFVVMSTMENSEYTNCAGYLKNCYLIFESDHNEDCLYSNLLKGCKNTVDSSVCTDSELCYECISCTGCYNLRYSQDCNHCRDSWFLKDCHDCADCIGCINQRHKQYMLFNTQYDEETYEKMKKELGLNSYKKLLDLQKRAYSFFLTQPHRNLKLINTENSSGDNLVNSKNAHECFDSSTLENCRYCQKLSLTIKDAMDYNSWGDKAELIYECSACGDMIYNLKFCATCTSRVTNSEYCIECARSDHLFGCVGLIDKKFCILNKQFTEKEYFIEKERIIKKMKETKEYGQFFPPEVLPFGYNETLAQDHFPLSKEEAIKNGFIWRDEDALNAYVGPKTVISDTIADTDESITDGILGCENCGKNYKIIKPELQYYKKNNIPSPHICPDCRHKTRQTKKNPYRLFSRSCKKCSAPIQTTYPPKRPEIVYCEVCYLKQVY